MLNCLKKIKLVKMNYGISCCNTRVIHAKLIPNNSFQLYYIVSFIKWFYAWFGYLWGEKKDYCIKSLKLDKYNLSLNIITPKYNI